jgi:ABC-type dipeptide/oligopeptide/nickel transport system permease subunit
MNLIVGMDLGVFLAWIGTLLATLLCIIYGLYSAFMKKSEEKKPIISSKDEEKKQGEDT